MEIQKVNYAPKGTIWHIIFYIDGLNPIWRTTECTSRSEAKKKRREIEERLLAELKEQAAQANAGNGGCETSEGAQAQGTGPATTASKPEKPPRKSIVALLQAIMDSIGIHWKASTRWNYGRAGELIVEALGERAQLEPEELDPVDYVKVREKLDQEIPDASRRQVAGMIRRLTRELIQRGLPPGCLHHLNSVQGKSQNEASGEPFTAEHIRQMLARLPQEPEFIKGMVYLGLSGGPQMIDVATLEHDEINRETGMVRRNRIKVDDAKVEFALLPRALEWVRSRYKEGDIYVFPELYFREAELKDPNCNRKAVPLDKRRTHLISTKGIKVFADFLRRAGITSKNLSFKSFRQYLVSLLSSLGIKEKVRMRMTGHQVPWSHTRYDFPSEWEFLKARDIVDQNLTAILEGKNVRYVLSHGGVVEEIDGALRQESALADARAQQRHNESLAFHGENHVRLQTVEQKIDTICVELSRLVTVLQLDTHPDDPANDGPEENLLEADQPLAGRARSTPPNGETLLLPPLVLPPGRNPTGRNGENHGGAGEGPRT
jgi:hypothetical protein